MVVKALAKLVYDFAFSNRRPENGEAYLNQLLDGITEIDFSHQNFMWQYFDLSDEQREEHGLLDLKGYLPPEDSSVNRDIGKFQGGHMRFGAKHNDIYPILADMIRWKLRRFRRDSANGSVIERETGRRPRAPVLATGQIARTPSYAN